MHTSAGLEAERLITTTSTLCRQTKHRYEGDQLYILSMSSIYSGSKVSLGNIQRELVQELLHISTA